ncbi:hypothetical protein ASJ81_03520 [Methanosarcina spelaei]|uniref:Uncharacterized protein n=1 Tax=Methanosarcina spelaei TaxID=1036679 RepID=A0A2A2HW46_9EURY|nr:hypothetical protein ASJ81_03520 [Methanosarcina spelaei]
MFHWRLNRKGVEFFAFSRSDLRLKSSTREDLCPEKVRNPENIIEIRFLRGFSYLLISFATFFKRFGIWGEIEIPRVAVEVAVNTNWKTSFAISSFSSRGAAEFSISSISEFSFVILIQGSSE